VSKVKEAKLVRIRSPACSPIAL